ncbi:MAG: hypothetical protein ACLBM1_07120, partial [Cuspidothrix sp.]
IYSDKHGTSNNLQFSSINILTLGLSTVGHRGTYATGDLPSWAIGVNLSSNGKSVNVESPRL